MPDTSAAPIKKYDELYEKSIPAFNEAMRAKGYVQLMTVMEPEEPPADETKDDDDEGGDDGADGRVAAGQRRIESRQDPWNGVKQAA